ncbi:hypothetical protein [Halorubrum sp. ASP121]|uniref:hypothetical protein n=1 Tax=Halorubrum sp. ASP121 TaxID=1855858 RepID=UPI0013052848|nr:hypothetical protein [Halorubrum sp. ASP121]
MPTGDHVVTLDWETPRVEIDESSRIDKPTGTRGSAKSVTDVGGENPAGVEAVPHGV